MSESTWAVGAGNAHDHQWDDHQWDDHRWDDDRWALNAVDPHELAAAEPGAWLDDETFAALVQADERAAAAAELTEDLTGWSHQRLLGDVVRLERANRRAAARSTRLLAELSRRRDTPEPGPHGEAGFDALADEVAALAGITAGTASARLDTAATLQQDFPRTLALLGAGLLAPWVAARIAQVAGLLPERARGDLETRLLRRLGGRIEPRLPALTPAELAELPADVVTSIAARATTTYLNRVLRELLLAVDPEGAARRRETARADRRLVHDPGHDDGLAWLAVHAAPELTHAAYTRIDTLARTTTDPTDPRTLDHKRADIALALWLGHTPTPATDAPGTPATPIALHVTIDLTGPDPTLDLPGLGPTTTDGLRDLLDLLDPPPRTDPTGPTPPADAARAGRDRGSADRAWPGSGGSRHDHAGEGRGRDPRTRPDRAAPDRAAPDPTPPADDDRAGRDRGSADRAWPGPTPTARAGRDGGSADRAWPGPGGSRHDHAGEGRGRDPRSRPDRAAPDQAAPDRAAPDRAAPAVTVTRLTRRAVARLACPGPAVHDAQGPGPYEPSRALKALLRVRFRTCQFPTCSRPARHCELDHTIRHPDGPTCLCNLAHP